MTIDDIKKIHGHDCDILFKEAIHEPFVPDGINSIKGSVLYKKNFDQIKCAECDFWGINLNAHIRVKHNKTVKVYKWEHGLFQKTALVSRGESARLRSLAIQNIKTGKIAPGQLEYNLTKKAVNNRIKSEYAKGSQQIMMKKNLDDLCPMQINRRLNIVRQLFQHNNIEDITSGELRKGDIRLYNVLRDQYGTSEKACNAIGIKYVLQPLIYSRDVLITKLREFVLNECRIPTNRDLTKEQNMPSIGVYVRHFGSWNRSKHLAGLSLLLKEIKLRQNQAKAIDKLAYR